MTWLLNKLPFGVQTKALEAARDKRGWGHFLEQGLGKTAVALAEYELYKKEGVVDCLIVVCPPTLMLNWKREVELFGVKSVVHVWDAKKKDTVAKMIDSALAINRPFIFIMNYESVIASGGAVLNNIVKQRKALLVVDESISVKNPTAQRSKFLRLLSTQCAMVRILSGAPVTQGVQDLWAQLRLLGALEKMNYFAYRAHFCQMGGYMGRQVVGPREDTAPELTELLKRWSWRAEKKDWTDIPDKLYTQRDGEMTGEQKRQYEHMLKDFTLMLNGDERVTADMVLTQLGKLQQITTGFVIDGNEQVHWLIEDDSNPKLQMLLATLEETPNKSLIFVYHRAAIDLLRRNLPADRTAFLIGGLTRAEFEAEKDRFNRDDSVDYAVCQITAAMYGHTLLGTPNRPCHTSVFFENVFSLNARVQSEDRNHRHGQRNNVLNVDLVVSPTDRMAVKALTTKRSVADLVMEEMKR